MNIIIIGKDSAERIELAAKIEKLCKKHKILGGFENGQNVFEYLKNNDVDLVIIDVNTTVMPGIQLIEKCNKILDIPPIFVVSSTHTEFQYVKESMRCGAVDYLLKPVEEKELKLILGNLERVVKKRNEERAIINKSITILRKDFFRRLLFTEEKINHAVAVNVLKQLKLDFNYAFKMIIIESHREKRNNITNKFIESVIEYNKKVQYVCFYHKDFVYIIFFIHIKNCANNLEQFINKNTDIFIGDNMVVYIFKSLGDIFKLRKDMDFFNKFIKKIHGDLSPKKYFFYEEINCQEFLKEKERYISKTSINLAKEYVKENYYKNITLKDVADKIYLSQNYLCELFKKETNEGFYEYLSKYRVKKAKELLLKTNLKIYKVAELVGYSDAISFGRVFKKLTGKTPKSFRIEEFQKEKNNSSNFIE